VIVVDHSRPAEVAWVSAIQNSEFRRQKTEDRRQKTEDRTPTLER
jgi:hypothetical protein